MKNSVVKIKFVTYSCSVYLNGKVFKRIGISNKTGENILASVEKILNSEINISEFEIYNRNELLEVFDNYKNFNSYICRYCDM